MRTTLKRSLLMPLIAAVIIWLLGLAFPNVIAPYYQELIILAGINIVLAVSLNLVNGFTGQFSIGHAGFMAIGAYMSAYLTVTCPHWAGSVDWINFFANTIVGGLAAGAAGYVVGLPSLRLKGDYLAIVTLGFGEIIRVVILNIDAVGGARGLYGIRRDNDFFWTFLWVFITCLVIARLMKSSHGRAFLSVREDEIAAEAMGINTTKYKVLAFVIGAFFGGVAGSLYAHYLGSLSPMTFNFMKSVDVVVMVVLGGMGSISGCVVAAIVITFLPEALRVVQEIVGVDLRMAIYALTLIILMLTRPQGLFGTLELSDLWKKYVRRSA